MGSTLDKAMRAEAILLAQEKFESENILEWNICNAIKNTSIKSLFASKAEAEMNNFSLNQLLEYLIDTRMATFTSFDVDSKSLAKITYNWALSVLAIGKVLDLWISQDYVSANSVSIYASRNNYSPAVTFDFSLRYEKDPNHTRFWWVVIEVPFDIIKYNALDDWAAFEITWSRDNAAKYIDRISSLRQGPFKFFNIYLMK